MKIDQSFVASLGSDNRVTELVRTIVQMGNNLGLRVIAEGIETAVQQEILAELGCPWGQGYLFSPPLPASELSRLLASERFGGNGRPRGAAPQAVRSPVTALRALQSTQCTQPAF